MQYDGDCITVVTVDWPRTRDDQRVVSIVTGWSSHCPASGISVFNGSWRPQRAPTYDTTDKRTDSLQGL